MKNELVMPSLPNSSVHVNLPHIASRIGLASNLHLHDEAEILYVENGKMVFHIYNKEYPVCSGEAIFVNSRIPHWTELLENPTTPSLLQFSLDAYSGNDTNALSKYLSRFINYGSAEAIVFKNTDPNTKEIIRYLTNINREYTVKKNAYDMYIKANIFNIMGFLYRNEVLYDAAHFFDLKNINKVMPALNYIDTHYNEEISLKAISNVMNLNEFYFCRLFKTAVNTTFTQYLNFVRVCKAEKLLSFSDKSISEISLETGFSSVSYFNRIFKKHKFCSPSDYRKIKYAQN